MSSPFNWEDIGFNGDEVDLEKLDAEFFKKIQPIVGQMSMFSHDKNFIFDSEEENNKISYSFEDIIYKNPSYTVGEIERLNSLGDVMDQDIPLHILREMFDA